VEGGRWGLGPPRRRRQSARSVVGAAAAIAAAALTFFVVRWALAPEPPPPIIKPPSFPAAPQAHPVIPPSDEPVTKPAQPFCEVRDLAMVATAVRQAQARALDAARRGAKNGGSLACRTQGDENEDKLAQAVNDLGARTAACVARDADLDSQWNQLDSAVLALGRCNDCTNRRDDRLVGCKRVLELIAAAEASMKK
jgi:hypothetical protein